MAAYVNSFAALALTDEPLTAVSAKEVPTRRGADLQDLPVQEEVANDPTLYASAS